MVGDFSASLKKSSGPSPRAKYVRPLGSAVYPSSSSAQNSATRCGLSQANVM